MNKELLRLKKVLLEANTPTREEELARALRVAFKGIDKNPDTVIEGITVEEAYKIIGWED